MQNLGNAKSVLEQAVGMSEVGWRPTRLRVILAALVPPLTVFALEEFLWQPAGRWSFFYPAVFACAWFGGRVSGIFATLFSTALIWWRFLPPQPAGRHYAVASVFVFMGILISTLVHRSRRNASALAQNQRFLQTILDYSPDAIVLKDLESRYRLVNKSFEKISGTTAEAALGRTPFEVFPHALAEQARANEEIARATKAPVRFEVTVGGRDVLVTEFPLLDASNNVFAIGAIETDISERKRDEKTLREAMEDLRTAQHVSHVGSWRWDFRSNHAKWSDELYEIFGVDRSQPPAPLVYPAAKLLTVDSLARLRGAMEKLRIDGEAYELDLEFTRPDGLTRWCAARGECVRDATDQIVGINGTIADITHIKELERLREEWTSIVAHDMRQPLGVISAASEMLPEMHEGSRDKERAMLHRIQSATKALTRMVDDLMDMSLLEANRLKLERKWADPASLVRGSVERLSQLTEGRATIHESGPRVSVCVDAMRIGQVVGNVLSNAVKYGDPTAAIDVRLERTDGEVEIAVTNSGKGIEPGDLPRLFDRFVRSKTTRASGPRGLGLGLYISKGIVEAHGGRMWADSVPGETTTFHITLPAGMPQQQQAA